ncbi:MAG: hypothetical protein Q7K41_01400, partial [Dehalococcoidales bacterium]|nr:hypothetical protein [Dehalococcoidales bacterium]
MDKLSRDEFKILMEKRSGTGGSVSLFMPTYKATTEIRQNPIRLKNLLHKAEEHLEAVLSRPVEARKFLKPIQQLLDDELFWQHPSDGLAIFLSQDMFRHYFLPLNFEELAVVSSRFHIKPLLPLFNGDGRFYVLALSQNDVKLFQCTRYGTKEIDLAGIVPLSLAAALRPDGPERTLQSHSGAAGKGKESGVFTGQGVGDVAKKNILHFFQQIDRGLHHEILKEENAPLVVAGVNYLHPIYKEANTYQHLFDKGIDGNPEGLTSEELHKRAWTLVQPHFDQKQAEAISEYRQLIGSGHTSDSIGEIVPNAYSGLVEMLFVAPGRQKWGTFDSSSNTVRLHEKEEPNDEDLLDFAAANTLIHRGAVYTVKPEQIPG